MGMIDDTMIGVFVILAIAVMCWQLIQSLLRRK